MIKLEDIYKKSFFGHRHKLQWRAKPLCDAVIKTTKIDKYNERFIIDVGCATGEFLVEFKNRGFNIFGIEGSKEAKEFIPDEIIDKVTFADLRQPIFVKDGHFDICLCLEVAEHIEEEYSDMFVRNLTNLSEYIIISAAPPGQAGHFHVNCKPAEYWEMKFGCFNYKRNKKDEETFKNCLEPYKKKKGLNAYYNNTLIFKKD